MATIFYDLETTDLMEVGQILNFAFVEVDENWNVLGKFYEKVKISKLQLPAAGAILANHINVIDHQKSAKYIEPDAMMAIRDYIMARVEFEPTQLIGFNTNRFDISFLRTSFIRNGVDPFFGKNCSYKDVLQVARKLALSNPDFHDLMRDKDGKISMRLENITRRLGLLQGSQSHDSLDDVLLTIKLAKYFAETFDIDVRKYSAYEPRGLERYGKVIKQVALNHESKKNYEVLVTPLEYNKNYALWINLDEYMKGTKDRSIVRWYNKNLGQFFVEGEHIQDQKLEALAEEATDALAHLNLDNFFPELNCDVERHPFMMSFEEIKAIQQAVWMNDVSEIKRLQSKRASQLYLRHLIAYTRDENMSADFDERLKKYALYRYGGKMKLSKHNIESMFEEGVYNPDFHPTFNELYSEIEHHIANPPEDARDAANVKALKEFYDKSAIKMLVGDQLAQIHRKRE